MVVHSIVGHRFGPDAIRKDDANGDSSQTRTKTTKGVEIRVEFNNGDTMWLPLMDAKASNPIELAEYAVAQEIDSEPTFAWLPKNVEEAVRLDRENGDTQWQDSIKK